MPNIRNGRCHLCGQYGELTYEHVPPRKAFNDRPVVTAGFAEVMRLGPGEQIRGPVQQRGAGSYTLCHRCNNSTGHWYGPSFISWCYQGLDILIKTNGEQPNLIYLNYLFPLRVIKQIITMFCSACGPDLVDAHPELTKFVLNRDYYNLNPIFRFFVFYNIEGRIRQSGVSGSLNTLTSERFIFSEIVFPPYGYVMTINSGPPDPRLVEIGFFSRYRYNDHDIKAMRLPLLPSHSHFPGDYRTIEEMERDASANEET